MTLAEFQRRVTLSASQACDSEPSSAEDTHLAEVAVESAQDYAQRRARENIEKARKLDQQHFDVLRVTGMLR